MNKITNYASQIYGQDQYDRSVNLLVPRNKFQFRVVVYHIGSNKALELTRISEIQMPSHSMKTQTLNQYNKKRTIQTGIDYTPISLSAYDTRDAEIEKFLVGYNNHYYSSPMSDNSDVMIDDVINQNFAVSGQSAKGFNLTNDRYYITKIEIIRTSSDGDKNIIEIYNPIITNIQGDTLNYSESAPVQYRIDFTYEGYKTTTNGVEVEVTPTITPEPTIDTVSTPVPAAIVVPGLSAEETLAADEAEVYNLAADMYGNLGIKFVPVGPTVEYDAIRNIHTVQVYNPDTNLNEKMTNNPPTGVLSALYHTKEQFEKIVSDYNKGQ